MSAAPDHRFCVRSRALAWLCPWAAVLLGVVCVSVLRAEGADELEPEADMRVAIPSSAEVRAALEGHIKALDAEAFQVLPRDAAEAVQVRLDGLTLHRCVRLDDDPRSFDCHMDLRLQLPGQRPVTRLVKLRLTRLIGEWLIN